VAIFEAAKGALVLLAGFGAFALIHRDAQHVAEVLVEHFHLNPASHYPRIFLHLAEQATTPHLVMLAAGALAYATLRFVEAYGLWFERTWAEWLAVISGSLYVPIEIVDIVRELTWAHAVLLAVNLSVVAYLARELVHSRRRHRSRRESLDAE
jgi:uncharacterized membrane protein (DUF2068 family)